MKLRDPGENEFGPDVPEVAAEGARTGVGSRSRRRPTLARCSRFPAPVDALRHLRKGQGSRKARVSTRDLRRLFPMCADVDELPGDSLAIEDMADSLQSRPIDATGEPGALAPVLVG